MKSVKIRTETLCAEIVIKAILEIEKARAKVHRLLMSPVMFDNLIKLDFCNYYLQPSPDQEKVLVGSAFGIGIELDGTLPNNVMIFKPEEGISVPSVELLIKPHKQRSVNKDLLWKLIKQEEF